MIDINAKIMEAMKSKDKVASETYKLLKAKILEFNTAKNAKPYNDAEEINLIKKMIEERKNTAQIYMFLFHFLTHLLLLILSYNY